MWIYRLRPLYPWSLSLSRSLDSPPSLSLPYRSPPRSRESSRVPGPSLPAPLYGGGVRDRRKCLPSCGDRDFGGDGDRDKRLPGERERVECGGEGRGGGKTFRRGSRLSA